MRYIDSVSRAVEQALGSWFNEVLSEAVSEVRLQSGFFSADAIGVLAPTLEQLANDDALARFVIGSNEPGTLGDHIRQLAELVGVPRQNAYLGIVRYSNAFFHPKVYHLTRTDGSQAAYVGSANFTGPGVSSQHVEAGMIVDTRDGDPDNVLHSIASAIDTWFSEGPEGFHRIANAADITRLVDDGVLLAAPPPRPPSLGNPGGGGSTSTSRPRLAPLFDLPTWTPPTPPTPPNTPAPPPAATPSPQVVSAPRQGFPAYLLFAPNAMAPSVGRAALSGTALPGAASGLVVRINRDSARHFEGRSGTANISVPVATLSTLRFGIYQGRYQRPRAEYDLQIRYCGASNTLELSQPAKTNVMAYGFAPGESGHGDVRMVVPAAVKHLRDDIRRAGLPVPADGDFALLEWPTNADPGFRLSFLERDSPVEQQAQQLFANATSTNELVGEGACWLPSGISPAW